MDSIETTAERRYSIRSWIRSTKIRSASALRKIRLLMMAIGMATLMMAAISPSLATTWYVRYDGSDTVNNGQSWSTPFRSIGHALQSASSGDQVHVATNPNSGGYVETLTVPSGVQLMGGYKGTGSDPDTQDPVKYPTIINGTNNNGNSVISISNAGMETSVNGFIITHGSGNDGAGIYLNAASVKIQNNIIEYNKCVDGINGGAGILCNNNSNAIISNNIIINNISVYSNGGGISCSYSSPIITDNLIKGNYSNTGGGLYFESSSATVMRNRIYGNVATYTGGAIDCEYSPMLICDNLIYGNTSNSTGGVNLNNSSAIVTNNSFVKNSSWMLWAGGAVTMISSSFSNNVAHPKLGNNIITDNSSGVYCDKYTIPTISNNCVYQNAAYDYQGTASSGFDIKADPLFLDAQDGDFHISAGSPCRDQGSNSYVSAGETDIDGDNRIWPNGGTVDIGADEYVGARTVVKEFSTYYVNHSTGNDANDGKSWATALKTITTALQTAQPCDQVWVAAGTYMENITMKNGVALYGGFAGNETLLNQRNWVKNITTINGSQNGSVVTADQVGSIASLDGFTVTNGQADGGGIYCSSSSPSISNDIITMNLCSTGIWGGGGINCTNSSPMIFSNTIINNKANNCDGGGIFLSNSSPVLSNNTISGNTSTYSGGGICCNDSLPIISRNMIKNNTAYRGGGMYIQYGSNFDITANVITNNSSTGDGGGLYIDSSSPVVTSNVIASNSALSAGGIYLHASAAHLVNNTIVSNNASTQYDAGAIEMFDDMHQLRPLIANNIIASNSSGVLLDDPTSSQPDPDHNCWYNNGGFKNWSPISLAGAGDLTENPDINSTYHLLVNSPCINKGFNHTEISDPGDIDFDGNPRIVNGTVDIGADEYQNNLIGTVITVSNVSGQTGSSVTLTASLKRTDTNAVIAGKTITFKVDSTTVGTATTNSSGGATHAYSIPTNATTGNRTITASFAGDTTYSACSGTGTLTVSTTVATSIVVNNASGKPGSSVTLTAALKRSDTNAVIAGKTITFKVDSTTVGTATTNSSGVATHAYSIPTNATTGNRTITASFAGDTTYSACSGTGTLTVTKAATTIATALTVPNVSGVQGKAVSLTATLKRTDTNAVVGSKTITFKVDNTQVGTATTNSSGVATLSYTIPSTAAAGSHTITASFAGDTTYTASSGTGTLTVTAGSKTIATAITVPNVSGVQGKAVNLTATLKRTDTNAVVGSKTITFKVDNTQVGTATTNASGVATLSYTIASTATAGSHTITASFAGDTTYTASSGTGTLTVTTTSSTIATALIVADSAGGKGQSVGLYTTLKRTDNSAGIPSETVTFNVDNVKAGVATTDSNGVATIEYAIPSSSTVGDHTVSVNFAGEGSFKASSSTAKLTVTTNIANRILPAGYAPGVQLGVSISVKLSNGVLAYAVQDTPPAGWIVDTSSISDSGVFDSSVGEVKWGPFFDSQSRTLTYKVTPPSSSKGMATFTGSVATDNSDEAIGGDSTITTVTGDHPADTNNDWRLIIGEVVSYASAWKKGDNWPVGPNPIPINYVTNAALIWLHGEFYHLDPSQPAPACWVPGASKGLSIAEIHKARANRHDRSGSVLSKAVMSCKTGYYIAGHPVRMTIQVHPAIGSGVFAVEEKIPVKWVPISIGEGGVFDKHNSALRWGPFFGSAPKSIEYTLLAPYRSRGIQKFNGTLSVDGSSIAIQENLMSQHK